MFCILETGVVIEFLFSRAKLCPPLPNARTVPMPCFKFFATSHILTGYAITIPTSVASDIIPQKRSDVASMLAISRLIRITITGIIPAITAFIESHSGKKDSFRAALYDPPTMPFINKAWKIKSPNAKPKVYSEIVSIHIGKPKDAVTTAATIIPVASPAMQ